MPSDIILPTRPIICCKLPTDPTIDYKLIRPYNRLNCQLATQ